MLFVYIKTITVVMAEMVRHDHLLLFGALEMVILLISETKIFLSC